MIHPATEQQFHGPDELGRAMLSKRWRMFQLDFRGTVIISVLILCLLIDLMRMISGPHSSVNGEEPLHSSCENLMSPANEVLLFLSSTFTLDSVSTDPLYFTQCVVVKVIDETIFHLLIRKTLVPLIKRGSGWTSREIVCGMYSINLWYADDSTFPLRTGQFSGEK